MNPAVNLNLNNSENIKFYQVLMNILFFQNACDKINLQLQECMRFNIQDKLSCGEIYKAKTKCKSFLEKLKQNNI